jgi:hypothetical protein
MSTPTQDEVVELLYGLATDPDTPAGARVTAASAIARLLWRNERDAGAAAKRDKGKTSRATTILEELQESDEDQD